MKKEFGKIGILMGGPSNEREISLRSGTAVYEALKGAGYDVVTIDVKETDSLEEEIKKAKIDAAFVALHGGFGEDGTIQALLERSGIAYTGSGVIASRLSMDKVASRRIFEKLNIQVPTYKVLWRDGIKSCSRKACFVKETKDMPLPVVVKPSCCGSSIGLTIVDRESLFAPAMELAHRYSERLLIEEYIPGREMTVGILEDRPLPVIEIVPKNRFFDYQAKYEVGKSEYVPVPKLKEGLYRILQDTALNAHRALGCRHFSRVDMILSSKDEPIVLEVNSIPGLTKTSLLPKAAEAGGLSFLQLCEKMLESAG